MMNSPNENASFNQIVAGLLDGINEIKTPKLDHKIHFSFVRPFQRGVLLPGV